jgi:hypothetical protein
VHVVAALDTVYPDAQTGSGTDVVLNTKKTIVFPSRVVRNGLHTGVHNDQCFGGGGNIRGQKFFQKPHHARLANARLLQTKPPPSVDLHKSPPQNQILDPKTMTVTV